MTILKTEELPATSVFVSAGVSVRLPQTSLFQSCQNNILGSKHPKHVNCFENKISVSATVSLQPVILFSKLMNIFMGYYARRYVVVLYRDAQYTKNVRMPWSSQKQVA